MTSSATNTENHFDVIIENGRTESQYWLDLWKYRELFYFLAWRDLLVRYKQTVFGVTWSLIRPLLTMAAFVVVFGHVAKLDSKGIPYPILVFTALLPWQLFSSVLADSSNSLVANSNMISKVYFPRIIVPLSTVIVCLADFAFSLIILICLMIYYKYVPSINLYLAPVFLILSVVSALGLGLLLASLNVKYRDFRYVVPFIVQVGLYISPVGFDSSIVPDQWRFLYSLNPIVGVIDGFRWSILGGESNFYVPGFLISILLVCILMIGGIKYFRATEKSFVDKI